MAGAGHSSSVGLPFEYALSVERLDGYANLTHYRRTRLTE
jgi:hypothetical protein